jgi:hypothetical protein
MASSVSRLGLVAALALALLHCQQRPSPEQSAQALSAPLANAPLAAEAKPKPTPVVAALDVSRAYPVVESIGANRRFKLGKTDAVDAHSPPDAWKIEFESRGGFGGFCWKNKAG